MVNATPAPVPLVPLPQMADALDQIVVVVRGDVQQTMSARLLVGNATAVPVPLVLLSLVRSVADVIVSAVGSDSVKVQSGARGLVVFVWPVPVLREMLLQERPAPANHAAVVEESGDEHCER